MVRLACMFSVLMLIFVKCIFQINRLLILQYFNLLPSITLSAKAQGEHNQSKQFTSCFVAADQIHVTRLTFLPSFIGIPAPPTF